MDENKNFTEQYSIDDNYISERKTLKIKHIKLITIGKCH